MARKKKRGSLVLRQLARRFGVIEPEIKQRIRSLSISQLEDLAEALLDFTGKTDLTNYLASISA